MVLLCPGLGGAAPRLDEPIVSPLMIADRHRLGAFSRSLVSRPLLVLPANGCGGTIGAEPTIFEPDPERT